MLKVYDADVLQKGHCEHTPSLSRTFPISGRVMSIRTYSSIFLGYDELFNPLTPMRTQMSPFTEISILF